MKRCFSAVVGVGVFSLLLGGCQPADAPGDGDVAEVRQAQVPVNPDHDWRHYYFQFGNDLPFADLLVIGDHEVGDFKADTEYWFVETSSLQYLGEEDLVASYTDGDGTPPSLSGDQEFTQPVYLTWQSFSTDPVSTGELYSNSKHHLRIKADGGAVVRLTWYQVLPHQSPENAAPEGTFSAVGGSVAVPSGRYGYYIDATIE
jgi:hypothetical protein